MFTIVNITKVTPYILAQGSVRPTLILFDSIIVTERHDNKARRSKQYFKKLFVLTQHK